MKFHR